MAIITDLTTGSEKEMIRRFLAAAGSTAHVIYEPLSYEPLKAANREVFGAKSIPSYRIDKADFLISLSADFLETWISNVEFARQFACFREPKDGVRRPFVYVGPRLSLTGAAADEWVPVTPGGQSVFAFGLLRLLLEKNHAPGLTGATMARLASSLSAFTPDLVKEKAGVKEETLRRIAGLFMASRDPLVLAEGNGYQDLTPLDSARAANLLSGCALHREEIVDFSRASALSSASGGSELEELKKKMHEGTIDVLFMLRANPTYHLAEHSEFLEAMKRVKLVVSLSSFPDETGRHAHLILPTHTFLESWGDFEPYSGVHSLLQPVTSTVFDTRDPVDMFLALGRALKGVEAFPEKDSYEVVNESWEGRAGQHSARDGERLNWQTALKQGGSWVDGTGERTGDRKGRPPAMADQPPPSVPQGKGNYSLISYPTVQFFDGRTANRPFLQELSDPITATTWGGWVEVHPQTASNLGVGKGDVLAIRAGSTVLKAPVYPYAGIVEGVLAVPMSHFHSAFGRYASAKAEGNIGGIIQKARDRVEVAKDGGCLPLAHTDGSDDQHHRDLARSLDWEAYKESHGPPEVVLPLSSGFTRERDFYPPHKHDTYRWSMVIDLDRCIGCGACVVACYAENNVAVVGREQVLKGREMAWLHVQRYFEHEQPTVRFLPMLCQHCDEAPCESVCPVFAPHHSKEGINNQVYNRCIGTRYCSQNCPYKVPPFQLARLEMGTAPGAAAQPRPDGADEGRHGEMLFLHPAHHRSQDRGADRGKARS